MDLDESMANTTVALSRGTLRAVCGRASATSRQASAEMYNATGTYLRQRGGAGATFGIIAAVVNSRADALLRRSKSA
jgi:hypothetical protein